MWESQKTPCNFQAADRYKKLLSKPCQVHKLETKEGALLCGDDLLGDVIEDKDKLGKSHISKNNF